MDCYTKLSVEIKHLDGEITAFELSRNAWDLDGNDMGQLFRQMMGAMGFTEHTIESVFGDDIDLYSEMWDDDARLEPCCPTLRSVEDPCCGCEESCDDTACLHVNDAGPILGGQPASLGPEWHRGDGNNE